MSESLTESIVWTPETSEKGVAYEIGRPAVDSDKNNNTPKDDDGDRSKSDFTINVNWPFSSSGDWIYTSQDVRTVSAVVQARVKSNGGGIYSFRLEFHNTEHYDYHFKDEEGDSYRCNTFSNGNHFIRFNSTKPTIVQVRGH